VHPPADEHHEWEIMRKTFATLAAGAFAVAAACFAAQPAAAYDGSPLTNTGEPWITVCATPYGGHTVNGTYLTLWSCNGDDSQAWKWISTSQGREIYNSASGKCLTPSGGRSGTDGTQLTLWTCGVDTAQLFVADLTQGTVYTKYGNECITNYGGSFTDGTNLVLWGCNGSSAQKWSLS
jgi:hypothetical protein